MKSSEADDDRPVAIVGGGFSGTMAAAQLARQGIESVLIKGGGTLARGTAFSTLAPAHLLNVRAATMSAWPDEPDDLEVDEHDRAGDRIWALGPLTKARYWEIVAVPDIRCQAAAVAAYIEAELKQ